MGLVKEFKEFAMRGNVVDLAVGLIVGASFGKIVSSMVNDVIMPPVGKIIGGVNFSELRYSIGKTIEKSAPDADGKVVETVKEAFINYGLFLQYCFDFLIVSFVVFMLVKAMNHAKAVTEKKEAQAPAAPAPPSEDILLLREIRDALKAR
jgi:large conductance mechanosensitive channel